MIELEEFIKELNAHFENKALQVQQRNDEGSYSQGMLINRKNDIASFQQACLHVDKDPFLRNSIIENFKAKKNEIKALIDKI